MQSILIDYISIILECVNFDIIMFINKLESLTLAAPLIFY